MCCYAWSPEGPAIRTKFLRFPHLIVFKREAAPSGEQIAFLFLACMHFQTMKMLMSKMSIGEDPLWEQNGMNTHLQITETKISPQIDKLTVFTKNQLLSVGKLGLVLL